MASSEGKPAKNRGDTYMAIGALMIALSIVLSMLGLALGDLVYQFLLYGGLGIAIVGVAVRSSLRRKARKGQA